MDVDDALEHDNCDVRHGEESVFVETVVPLKLNKAPRYVNPQLILMLLRDANICMESSIPNEVA